jgi:uncharacterized repeat protein (TIGR03803 family)
VVFQLSPDETGTAWTETVLYSFCSQTKCPDGANPAAGLIMDGAGNLYGTTLAGNDRSCGPTCSIGRGVVFQLTPDETGTAWTETVLYSFCPQTNCPDGANPQAGLIMDGAGNLYGTTFYGGTSGRGVVFQLRHHHHHHHPHQGTAWTETVLYSFCSQTECADGAHPYAGLIMDGAGSLYGTTSGGNSGFGSDRGVVFALNASLTARGQRAWQR